jgi:predicted RNA-binding protein with PIN domain
MPKVTFQSSKIAPQERKNALRELARRVDASESLEELLEEMKQYEKKFGMSTVVFYAKYLKGEMGDGREVMKWAMVYQAYTRLVNTYFVSEAANR